MKLAATLGLTSVHLIAAITWTPVTFYVACGIIHLIVILLAFRVLDVDPEANTFIGALIAAVVINLAAYFVRDMGIVGIIIIGVATFGSLTAISGGEAVKAAMVSMALIAIFGGLAAFIVPRTPLDLDDLAGMPRVIMTGGLEPQPITEETANELLKR